jgi:hypothetical protein
MNNGEKGGCTKALGVGLICSHPIELGGEHMIIFRVGPTTSFLGKMLH